MDINLLTTNLSAPVHQNTSIMPQQPEIQTSNPPPVDASHGILKVDPILGPNAATSRKSSQGTLDEDEIQRIKSENSVRRLPRKTSIGGSTFYISYGCLIYSGKYSIHHAVRAPTKQLFSVKIDDRDLAMVLRDENIRSKLTGLDLPKIILSERQTTVTLNVMEHLSMTFKNLIRGFSSKRENRLSNSAILLRIGRMCIRILKKMHDNGILHGNINPTTFILPCDPERKDAKPDLKRGPLIVDFSHAIDTKEDVLYKEKMPKTRFNSAIYAEDGGIYTKRDDMENLGYVLLFLANGHIPWEVRKRRDLLLFGKTCVSELDRYLRGIPQVIKNYLTCVRTIKWNNNPDYELLDLCLTRKNFDVRAEMKARKEKLKMKRKRDPSMHNSSQKSEIGEGFRKSHKEQTGNTAKRQKLQKNFAFEDNALAAEPESGYMVMSLQMFPDIAVKFSVTDKNVPDMTGNRMILNTLDLSPVGTRDSEEDSNHGTLGESSVKCARSNGEEEYGKDTFSIPGNDEAVVGIEDDVGNSGGDAASNLEDILSPGELWSTHENSSHHNEHAQTPPTTRNPDNIQFHFPFETEDELRHPWDDDLGFLWM